MDSISVAGNVMLTSTVAEDGRQYACEGEMVTFTCQVIRSFSLQWDNPLISPISFTSDPVNTMTPMSPFTATLTSTAGVGSNRNLTSTLQVTALSSFRRSDTTVVCRNQGRVNQTSRFTVAGMIRQHSKVVPSETFSVPIQLSGICLVYDV